tara:strand:- start:385 stop:879 length:495 start_codon:yes stop_codon:yes gene_type:complete
MREDLKDLVKEALELNTRLKKDKIRLSELKSTILAESDGRNASFKIFTELGEARFNKRKEKLTYSFDEKSFTEMDENVKKDLIENKIVEQEISYHLNFEKYEIIKKYPNNDHIKSLVKEHFKNSYFTLAFYPSQSSKKQISENKNENSQIQNDTLINKFKKLFR